MMQNDGERAIIPLAKWVHSSKPIEITEFVVFQTRIWILLLFPFIHDPFVTPKPRWYV